MTKEKHDLETEKNQCIAANNTLQKDSDLFKSNIQQKSAQIEELKNTYKTDTQKLRQDKELVQLAAQSFWKQNAESYKSQIEPQYLSQMQQQEDQHNNDTIQYTTRISDLNKKLNELSTAYDILKNAEQQSANTIADKCLRAIAKKDADHKVNADLDKKKIEELSEKILNLKSQNGDQKKLIEKQLETINKRDEQLKKTKSQF